MRNQGFPIVWAGQNGTAARLNELYLEGTHVTDAGLMASERVDLPEKALAAKLPDEVYLVQAQRNPIPARSLHTCFIEEGRDGAKTLMREYGIYTVPTDLVINPDGEVADRSQGARTEQALMEMLQSASGSRDV